MDQRDAFGRHAKRLADMQGWLPEMRKLGGRFLRSAARRAKNNVVVRSGTWLFVVS